MRATFWIRRRLLLSSNGQVNWIHCRTSFRTGGPKPPPVSPGGFGSANQCVVFRMRPDPEPRDRVALQQTQGPPSEADANGIQIFVAVNPLEVQARVRRVVPPQPVTPAGLLLDGIRQLGKARQEILCELRVHN